jgi:hypothetical protein
MPLRGTHENSIPPPSSVSVSSHSPGGHGRYAQPPPKPGRNAPAFDRNGHCRCVTNGIEGRGVVLTVAPSLPLPPIRPRGWRRRRIMPPSLSLLLLLIVPTS